MADVCVCKFPIWMYDKDNKEYFAIPVDIAEEKGIQKQKEDLEITVEIEGKDVKFLAIPFETVEKRHIEIPEVEMIDYDIPIGLSGDHITKQFTKVTWKKVTDEFIKKYEIKGHIVIAGCKHPETLIDIDKIDKSINGPGSDGNKLHCTEKEIFAVLHPMDEFLDEHFGDIETVKESP